MAHHIWTIPELVEAIVSRIPGGEEEPERLHMMAGLARTARLFFEPAMGELWANVSLIQLVHQLNKVLAGGGDREGLLFYTRKVRFLGLPFEEDDYSNHLPDYAIISSSQELLLQLLESNNAFARLSRLSFHIEQHDVNDEMHDLFHDLGKRFLAPSLREFHYTNFRVNRFEVAGRLSRAMRNMTAIFSALPLRCPDLRCLSLWVTSTNDATDAVHASMLDVLANVVEGLSKLHSVALPAWGVRTKVIGPLSTLKYLEEVDVGDIGDELRICPLPDRPLWQSGQGNWFPALRSLYARGNPLLLEWFFPKPTVVNASCPDPEYARIPLLQSIQLRPYSDSWDGDPELDLRRLLDRLRLSPYITDIDLYSLVQDVLTDEDIRLIASVWPRLQSLRLHVGRTDHPWCTALTARSLITLASTCTELKKLELILSRIGDVEIGESIEPNRTNIRMYLYVEFASAEEVDEDTEQKLEAVVERLWPAREDCTIGVLGRR